MRRALKGVISHNVQKFTLLFWPFFNINIKPQQDFRDHMATQDSKPSVELSLSRTDGDPEKDFVSHNNSDWITQARE